MTKTNDTRNRTKTAAYVLTGVAAFGAGLALILWIVSTSEPSGGIAPEAPVSNTTFWVILAVVVAVTLLVIVSAAIITGPKIARKLSSTSTNAQDTSDLHDH